MGKKLLGNPDKKESLFKRIYINNKFIFIAFLSSVFVMTFIYYCFGLLPFGGNTILRMDLYHQYGPLFAELYERIVGLKSFLYSWNSGLGSSFMGNFYNYLASPLSLIIVFFGHENIPEAISALILLKGAFASAAFAYYLKRSQNKNDCSIAAFGLLYSFCGFFIAYYWNVMWLDAMVLFPLAMLGIELIVKEKKFGLYVFALTMAMLTNYYMAFMLCIFAVLFYIVSFFSRYSFSSYYDGIPTNIVNGQEIKPPIWQKLKYSRFLRSGFIFAFSSLLSLCLAAFALVPLYFILKNCSATADALPKTFTSYYKIFDFLANHLANVDPTIRSSGNDVLPNVYCGIATIILIPLYLFTKSITIKEKSVYIALLGFLYFSFNINYANFIWHGFHFPNDLPYRFSFMYSFILLLLAYKAVVRLKEFTGRQILSTGIAVLFAIVLIQELGSKNVVDLTIITSLSFVVLYTLIFILQSNSRFPAAAFSLLLLISFMAEACIADTDRFQISQTKADYAGDLSDFETLKKSLDDYDGSFYRMELTSLRTRMDPCWYNYNGVSTFSSMAYEKVSNLQSKLGMAGNYINSYTYNPQTPVYNAMNSLKYIVNNSKNIEMNPIFYEQLFSKNKFTVFKNSYYLPIAYCTDSSLVNWDHSSSNPFVVQSDYFTKATGSEDPFVRLPITDAEYSNIDEIYSGFETGNFYFNKTNADSDASVTFIITPEVTQSCYLYVKSGNVDNITITAGDFILSHNDDREAIIDMGVRTAGEEIRVKLPISEGNSGSINLYAYGLDTAKFVDGYNKLQAGGLNITTFEETHIIGTVYAPGSSILYTSIPFDLGWVVTVNGQTLSSDKLIKIGDAMLGIPLDQEGPTTVEFQYKPTGLMPGVYISFTALTVLILFLIFRKLFNGSGRKSDRIPEIANNYADIPPITPGNYSYADFRPDSQDKPVPVKVPETWPRDTNESDPPAPPAESVSPHIREILEEDFEIIDKIFNE